MMIKRVFWQGTFGLTCLLALVACHRDAPAPPPAAKPALTVNLMQPSQQQWPGTVAASGAVAAWQEASIGSELTGVRLDDVLVNVGDHVKRGQLLAHYNEASLRAGLAQLDAQLAEARALAEKARLDADSAERLNKAGALSGQDLRAARTQALMSKAHVQSAQAQRDAQALRLSYARVIAPDNGVISARSATVGAVAMPGEELFRLIRGGRLEWRAEVRADALVLLKPGTPATLHLQFGRTVAGVVRQRGASVNPQTLNGIVYVDLPASENLEAGMFVSGDFQLPDSPALAVPESALVYRNGNNYVMEVDAEHRIHERKVQTHRRRDKMVEIVEGIGASAHIVVSGGAFLNDGDLVTVADEHGKTP